MNGIDLVLRALHHGESRLADELTAVADRHRADHEVHHVATDLAHWSHEHTRRLADTAHDRGLNLDDRPAPLDDPPEPAPLLLLYDLRDLHLRAARNSLHWEMLAQVAQATRDDALLALASACHPQTLRQMRWTNTMIKNLSPQALTSL
ncbi:hypothetical protein [Streptomyces adelaidensis]|uniref:hypothetical protein n=1 Tax=Streptomyces adelaidensis TaxID=2796465 RepID=UPI0019055C7B|nr:hypothetical protein [Streptomyces adelaidensis]